jgi:zinc transport system substrate-binding protein
MRSVLLSALVVGMALAAACGDGGRSKADGRIDVVASFYAVAEAARQVGGNRVRVRNLTPAGAEPHDVELSPRQVDQIDGADVVLYVGRDFQPAVEELAARRDRGSVDLLEAIPLHGATPDPHFWLDPQRMATAVDEVADALAEVAPADTSMFRNGAARYRKTLTGLDAEMRQGLASCARDEIVTAHAAFFYLAERYGLTQLAISGLSPEAEPDPERLASLSETIRAKGITTIFYEELVSPDVARTLARETGAHAAVLSPIEGLTEEQAGRGESYVTLMRENLGALRKALACT